MTHSSRVVQFRPQIDRRFLHTFVARENHFKEAGGAITAVVVFMGVFVLLGIILAILAIIVLVRRSGNRGPYLWLLPAACTFALFNLLDIPRWIMWYDDDMNFRVYNNLTAASSIFYWWTITSLFSATLFLLRNRRNAAMVVNSARPGALGIVKLLVDLILLLIFSVLALARSAYLASVNNGEYGSRAEYENKISTFYGMGYGLVVTMFLLVLDLVISAVNVRLLVSGPDLVRNLRLGPSTTPLAVIVPMFVFHWMYQTGIMVYSAISWYRRLVTSKRTDDAIGLFTTLEPGLIMSGIMLALLIVGLKSTAWGKPVGRHTVYSAQPGIQNAYSQQPQYFQQHIYQPQQVAQYPQQQQQQLHAQPRVVYAPTSPQQQVVPNLPQV